MHPDTRRYNAALSAADRKTCDLLAKEIDRQLPEAENRVWHAHPVWFLDGNPVVGYSRLKDGVRLLFWSGQSFAEGGLRKEGSFKAAEVRYTSAGDVDTQKLGRWLAESRSVQWDYKNIVRRKGRLERLNVEAPASASASAPAPRRKASPARPRPKPEEGADWKKRTLARVRALVLEAVPGAVEDVKWRKPSNPDGVPAWSSNGLICTGETCGRTVKLTFASGAALPDPKGLFNAGLGGGTRRAIDIGEGDVLDERAFKALVRAAAALNGRPNAAKGPGTPRVDDARAPGPSRRRAVPEATPAPGPRGPVSCAPTGGGTMPGHRIFTTSVASVYPHYVKKAERNARTKAEVDRIICWLTGYSEPELQRQLRQGTDFETFFAQAPALHPNSALIKGVVCGVRVEEVEDPLMRKIRWLDKLIDELARGRAMEKILRS
ncbi:MAG: DUF2200 family protein [Thermoanaerobaculia bacterium]|nr:DUF2200 family protein [Thermoanaerobaculia bacterium]